MKRRLVSVAKFGRSSRNSKMKKRPSPKKTKPSKRKNKNRRRTKKRRAKTVMIKNLNAFTESARNKTKKSPSLLRNRTRRKTTLQT